MGPSELPSEIWAQIFNQAADEDVIFQYGLPTAMAESAWVKNVFEKWTLRRPSEALNVVQRRSYTTKKAIVSTCKTWNRIGSELLFRCLYFSEPQKLISLCKALDSSSTASTISSSLGWWTRRIHLARYNRNATMNNVEDALISVIKHCPNLEIFIVDVPMGVVFGPSADTLATYAFNSLKTVHWTVSCEALPKVIWALDSLPSVVCAHIDFELNDSEDIDNVRLGSASDLRLTLRYLQQLSLQGYFGQFLEQAAGWRLPSLKVVSFDCGNHRSDQPDAVSFLEAHGANLVFLDLNCIPALDVPKILDFCPLLQTFCFNADWRVQAPGEEVQAPGSNTVNMAHQTMSVLVNQPHFNITTIGLHGLMYAFGVGYAAEYSCIDPIRAHVIQRSNDLNVAALNKVNFPKLQRVRALSRLMLVDLNEADGPSAESGGLERYDNWWHMLTGNGIRLEDCTGALLGTLPQDEVEEGEEEESDDEDGDWEYDLPPNESDEEQPVRRSSNVEELRQLLAECRAMAAERPEPMFPPMFGGMIGPGPPMNSAMDMPMETGMYPMGMSMMSTPSGTRSTSMASVTGMGASLSST